MLKKLSYIIIIFVLITSCKKNTDEVKSTENTNNQYYPVKVGTTLFYNVTEINIDKPINKYDTVKYTLKEFFESSFIDQTGNTNYRIERYKKYENDTIWVFDKASYVMVSKQTVERTDDNIRIVNINFPLKLNKTWNGNAKNSLDFKEFTISNLDYKQDNYTVLDILQDDNENLIEKYYSIEKYAKNIGLIYKEVINIEELEPLPGIDWHNRINRGDIFIQELVPLMVQPKKRKH